MAGVNKVIILGNLGGDPDMRYTQSGSPVANFTVATNERWTGKDGQSQERTEWHRIVVFGRLAELCRDYLSKGRQVYLEGRLQTRKWEDKDGNRRSTTEIVAQTIQFLGRGGSAGGQGGQGGSGGDYAPSNNYDAPTSGGDGGSPPISDDDVPF